MTLLVSGNKISMQYETTYYNNVYPVTPYGSFDTSAYKRQTERTSNPFDGARALGFLARLVVLGLP